MFPLDGGEIWARWRPVNRRRAEGGRRRSRGSWVFSARSWRAFEAVYHWYFFSTVVKRSTREWNVKMFREGVRVTYMSAWTCRVSRTRKMLPCKATTEEVPSRNCQEDRRRRTWVSALGRLKEGTYVQNGFRRQCGRDRSGRDKLLWPGTGHGGSSQTGTVRGRGQWVALYPR